MSSFHYEDTKLNLYSLLRVFVVKIRFSVAG
ncbi:MAG: hypothetical protein QOG71_3759 [Pyrinomonadaceae bacterium]|nr:hypothetical protein [Pyrinomonadaceae bacterium]